MRMEDAYGADRQETISAVNVLMTKFGLDSKQALDFVAKGFQAGLNSSGDFLESVTEYGGKFSDSGLKADEFFSILETGLAAGVLGTDKAADMFKEFSIRIVDGSKLTADSLRKLGIDSDKMAKDLASGAKTSGDAFKEVMAALNATDDVVVRNQAGVGLLGTQYEDLGDKAALAINTTAVSMSDLAGASESLTEKTYTFAEAAKVLNRELELIVTDVLDQYGTSMSQLVSDFVKYVQDHHDAIVRNVEDIVSVVVNKTDELTDSISRMKSVYDAIPEEIVGAAGWGLAGRVVFGGWGPAKLVSAIYMINEGMTSLGAGLGDLVRKHQEASGAIQNIMDVFSGKRDWNTGVLVEDMKALGTAAGQTVTQIEAAAGRQIELNNAASAGIKNSTSGLWEYGKAIKNMDAEEEKALANRKKRNAAAKKDYEAWLQSQDKSHAASLKRQEKQREAAAKKAEKDNRSEAAEFIRLQEATFETVYRAYEDFRGGVKDIEASITDTIESEQEKRLAPWDDYFGTVRKGWDDLSSDIVGRVAPELADGVDSMVVNALDPWTDYFVELDGKWVSYKDGIAEYKGPIAEKVAEVTEEAKDPWKEFFDDMKFSWDDLSESALTAMEDIVSNGRSQLSDGFFGMLKGDMDSFSDVWKGFWDDLLRVASDVMAEITMKTAISGLGSLLNIGSGSSGSGGGGIFGGIASSALGKGASKLWGWNAAAGGAAAGGSGIMGSLGALASNPYTWGAAAALVGGGLIARNAMEEEIRQSIDDTDFGFFDRATLNTSAANGGGSDEYAALANEAVAAAQGDVIGLVGRLADVVPSALKDMFLDQLADMSVHLGGGGMVIREDHLGEDLQVMYKGTLYAMLVDTFDSMIRMMEQYQQQYGVDTTGQIAAGKQLQQQFFNFDPEGFWTGADQQLFDQYYDWYNKVYELSVATREQVTAQEAAVEAAAQAEKDRLAAAEEARRATDELYRDLGPTAQGYRAWEAFKIEEQAAEYSAAGASAEIVSQWLEKEMVELDRKIDDALAKTLPSQSEYISAMEKMYDVVGSVAEGYEQWEIGKLADEMNRLAETTGETVLAQQWYNTELAKFMSSIGAETQGETTEAPAYASGGVINRLIIPRGEDGFAAVQYGEGVVSRQGMAALEALNSGQIGSGQPINIQVILDGEPIKTMVYKYGDDLRVKTSRRPDVAGSRVYR